MDQQQADLRASWDAYRLSASDLLGKLNEHWQSVADLLEEAIDDIDLLAAEEWHQELEQTLALLRSDIASLREMQPPELYAEFHRGVVEGLGHWSRAAELIDGVASAPLLQEWTIKQVESIYAWAKEEIEAGGQCISEASRRLRDRLDPGRRTD